MTNLVFVLILAAVLAPLMIWSFRYLPRARWQVLAAIPFRDRGKRGEYDAFNMTFYGFIIAGATAFAAALFLVLMKSQGIKLAGIICLVVVFVGVGSLAAKVIARVVEKKLNTFSVGGASFVCFILLPFIVVGVNRTLGQSGWFDFHVPAVPFMGALVLAYIFGEGLGRLACISYGCCYGKPVEKMTGPLRALFSRWYFVFEGGTKKACYAGKYEGKKLVPIQGVTAVIYCVCGLVSLYLYLQGHFRVSFLVVMIVSQGWRALSELLRDDFRGGTAFTVYQKMALVVILYAVGVVLFYHVYVPATSVPPDVLRGVYALWDPAVFIFLAAVWSFMFIYFGKSAVTGSRVKYHLNKGTY